MADNVAYTPGSGATIAADDIGGVLHQRIKLSIGADGSATDLPFGQAVAASSLPVVLASDVGVDRKRAATSTLSNVSGSASSVTLLSANSSRMGAMIYNDSTAILYVKFGTTASTTSFTVKLYPDAYFNLPDPMYTGRIDGIWASAAGAARVTELTA